MIYWIVHNCDKDISMKIALIWLLLCVPLVANDRIINNATLLTTHHDTGYIVEAMIWKPHGVMTSGDQWSVAFADDRARKQFFDINNPSINKDIIIRDKIYSTTVNVVGTEVLNIYGKTIIIKSLHKSDDHIRDATINPPLRLKRYGREAKLE